MRDRVDKAAELLGSLARRDVPLGPLTTYRVGGRAALFVEADSIDALDAVREAVVATELSTLVVGKGSNLLVADAGFPGLAIVLGTAFEHVDIDGTTVAAGGAAPLPVAARRTAAAGLTGFEWAVGVPGSIGGAVRMNAGGHGSDMAASLTRVRVCDLAGGEDGWMAASSLHLGYRLSDVGSTHVVIEAELALADGDRAAAEAEIAEIVRWRRANQPGGQNAGSVFTNPVDESAGRLVDAAGLKGYRIGTAQVSPKHANFIIADADGRADDVWALMLHMQRTVWDVQGMWLEPETRLIGYNPEPEIDG